MSTTLLRVLNNRASSGPMWGMEMTPWSDCSVEVSQAQECVNAFLKDDEVTNVKYVTLNGDFTAFKGLSTTFKAQKLSIQAMLLGDK